MQIVVLILFLICHFYFDWVNADGNKIVAAARSQIGYKYVWGGGGWSGPSKGGYDCSGLAQYAVYKGTGKKIGRTTDVQYIDKSCQRIPYTSKQPGDLIFWGNGRSVYHVGIYSGPGKVIHAPNSRQKVKEASIFSKSELKKYVRRC